MLKIVSGRPKNMRSVNSNPPPLFGVALSLFSKFLAKRCGEIYWLWVCCPAPNGQIMVDWGQIFENLSTFATKPFPYFANRLHSTIGSCLISIDPQPQGSTVSPLELGWIHSPKKLLNSPPVYMDTVCVMCCQRELLQCSLIIKC